MSTNTPVSVIPAHLSTSARGLSSSGAPSMNGNGEMTDVGAGGAGGAGGHGVAMERGYAQAIELLNGCQSNAATIEAIRKSGGKMNQFAIPEMKEYLWRLGYEQADLNNLNVVHITGTKGKGSTSAFVERIFRETMREQGILRSPSDSTSEADEEASLVGGIGLYTSPHLCAVRERIRINGRPLPEAVFAKYFFEVWDRLTVAAERATSDENTAPSSIPDAVANPSQAGTSTPHPIPLPAYPVYFRLLTLVAFHVFKALKVKLTVLEVGVGGTYDSTNMVPKPLITGVTALGLDHTALLGNTIEEIAVNKGGIYKRGVKALSIAQENGKGEKQLKESAESAGASSFEIVPVMKELGKVKLGLRGSHQIINASLAVALARGVFESPEIPAELGPLKSFASSDSLHPTVLRALEIARWPGRCQTVQEAASPLTYWYLDGAHTVESLAYCGDWAFGTEGMRQAADRFLIFNCTSGRSADALLKALLESGQAALDARGIKQNASDWFEHVVFCTNVTYSSGGFKGDLTSKAIDPDDLSALATQRAIAEAWSSLVPNFPSSNVHIKASIEDAINVVRQEGKGAVDVLVAGSLHLVGGVIDVAELGEAALSME